MSESDLHINNKALRKLKGEIKKYKPADDIKLSFVLSYPRSDMGKGTLVAQLLSALPNSDVIKFDGLLNTNKSGRHTTPGHDDFGTYEQFNSGRSWGREHYILGGELYHDFIKEYGELENLRIKQHLSLYLELEIYKKWHVSGKHQILFIEVGGVLTDAEVSPIFVPLIQRMQRERALTEVILLTESAYNGEYIKTKTIQDGILMLLDRHITPTLIVAREPEVFKDNTALERLENERNIINRIEDNIGLTLHRVVSVPYFEQSNLDAYTIYVKKRIAPYFIKSYGGNKIVVGTSNDAKYKEFDLYLGERFEVQKGPDLLGRLDIPEGMHSIEENAIAKARIWANMTGLPALADDTGFFIESLGGEPGVAIRRWAGELGEEASNIDFWNLLRQKTDNLEDTTAYIEQCVAIVTPDGRAKVIYNRTPGYLDKNKLKKPYNGTGYPLAAAFVASNRTKAWDEMSNEEKLAFDRQFIDELSLGITDMLKSS